jgi:transcriptional regulator with XRE-family HTH domain
MLNIHMYRKQDIFVCFGKHVRELRKAKGFSQEAFAAHCGLDRTYIGGIERGERNVSLRNIEIIARALNKTISELMQGLEPEGDNG